MDAGGCPLNLNLRPRVVPDTQIWPSARDGYGKSYLLSEGIVLNSRGERGTNSLGGTEVKSRYQEATRSETRGDYLGDFAKPFSRSLTTWSSCLIGDLCPKMATSFSLIFCIIIFDLIIVISDEYTWSIKLR